MKNIKLYIFFPFFLLIGACTDDFQEINTNPNAPVNIQPELLLRQVIYDYGEQMSYEGFVAGNLLGQYMTAIDFNLFDRHGLKNPQLGGNPWPIIYQNLLDNEEIIRIAQNSETFKVYEGPALIMKAYMTAALTDIFGNVPYSEALNGQEGNVTPKFDDQQEIYLGENGILDNLERGIQSIKNYDGNLTLGGDILFEGNLNAWIQFANSLRIKAFMRISDRVNISEDLQRIFTEGNFISDNTMNATFDFTDGRPNNFRMATLREGDYNLFIMSETMQEILEKYDDTRAEILFRPAVNSGEFNGLRNGPDASQISISVADYSLSGSIFRTNTSQLVANFMTSWETHFLLAEAAYKGYITADAKALYETSVSQAYEYWHTNLPDDIFTTGNTSFGENGNDPLQQIIEQKWLANIINGYEGWIEWKRTGYPELKTVTASLNNNIIPVRMPYPSNEVTLNQEQLEKTSGNPSNDINQRTWWDID